MKGGFLNGSSRFKRVDVAVSLLADVISKRYNRQTNDSCTSVVLMLARRRRRWANIKTTLVRKNLCRTLIVKMMQPKHIDLF